MLILKPSVIVCFGETGEILKERLANYLTKHLPSLEYGSQFFAFLSIDANNNNNADCSVFYDINISTADDFHVSNIQRAISDACKSISKSYDKAFFRMKGITVSHRKRILLLGTAYDNVGSILLRQILWDGIFPLQFIKYENYLIELYILLPLLHDPRGTEKAAKTYAMLREIEADFKYPKYAHSPLTSCWLISPENTLEQIPASAEDFLNSIAEGLSYLLCYLREENLSPQDYQNASKVYDDFYYCTFGFKKFSWDIHVIGDIISSSLIQKILDFEQLSLIEKGVNIDEAVSRFLIQIESYLAEEEDKITVELNLESFSSFEELKVYVNSKKGEVPSSNLDKNNLESKIMLFLENDIARKIQDNISINEILSFLEILTDSKLRANDTLYTVIASLDDIIETHSRKLESIHTEISNCIESLKPLFDTLAHGETTRPHKDSSLWKRIVAWIRSRFQINKQTEDTEQNNQGKNNKFSIGILLRQLNEKLFELDSTKLSLLVAEINKDLLIKLLEEGKRIKSILDHVREKSNFDENQYDEYFKSKFAEVNLFTSIEDLVRIVHKLIEGIEITPVKIDNILRDSSWTKEKFLRNYTEKISHLKLPLFELGELFSDILKTDYLQNRFRYILEELAVFLNVRILEHIDYYLISDSVNVYLALDLMKGFNIPDRNIIKNNNFSSELVLFNISNTVRLEHIKNRWQLEEAYKKTKNKTELHSPDFDHRYFPLLFPPFDSNTNCFGRHLFVKALFSNHLRYSDNEGGYYYEYKGRKIILGKNRDTVIEKFRNPERDNRTLGEEVENWLKLNEQDLENRLLSFLADEQKPMGWKKEDEKVLKQLLF